MTTFNYHDLIPIAELGDGGGYEYNMIGAFENEGVIYLAHTSGCSCTSPYDDYESYSDMVSVSGRNHVRALTEGLMKAGYLTASAEEVTAFVNKVKEKVA